MGIEFDFSDLERKASALVRDCQRGVAKAVATATSAGLSEARSSAPTDTGELRSKIDGQVLSSTSGEIVSRAQHSSYVNSGTKAHTIEPRRKSVLRFEGGDGPVFARRVQHPGTAAQPFMDEAERTAQSTLTSKTVATVDAAAAKFNS